MTDNNSPPSATTPDEHPNTPNCPPPAAAVAHASASTPVGAHHAASASDHVRLRVLRAMAAEMNLWMPEISQALAGVAAALVAGTITEVVVSRYPAQGCPHEPSRQIAALAELPFAPPEHTGQPGGPDDVDAEAIAQAIGLLRAIPAGRAAVQEQAWPHPNPWWFYAETLAEHGVTIHQVRTVMRQHRTLKVAAQLVIDTHNAATVGAGHTGARPAKRDMPGPATPPVPRPATVTEAASRIMRLLVDGAAAGQIPYSVASFIDLHDHTDANRLLDQVGMEYDPGNPASLDEINTVTDEVTRRLQAGDLTGGTRPPR